MESAGGADGTEPEAIGTSAARLDSIKLEIRDDHVTNDKSSGDSRESEKAANSGEEIINVNARGSYVSMQGEWEQEILQMTECQKRSSLLMDVEGVEGAQAEDEEGPSGKDWLKDLRAQWEEEYDKDEDDEDRKPMPWDSFEILKGDIVLRDRPLPRNRKLERQLVETSRYMNWSFFRFTAQVMSMLKPTLLLSLLLLLYVRLIGIPWSESRTHLFLRILPYNYHLGDTSMERFLGSVYNSLLVLAAVVFFTAVYVSCIYFDSRPTLIRLLRGFIGILLVGPFAYFGWQVVVVYELQVDILSYIFCLANFAAVGAFAVLKNGYTTNTLTRVYLIILASAMAWPFTEFPEWSVWGTIVILTLYDLFAVLAPCGPLRYIMESEAGHEDLEPLPGMVYRGYEFVLGLGDFVFYGAVMGKAAYVGVGTMFATCWGILGGLALTMVWTVTSSKRAIPALPFSAVLGIGAYAVYTPVVMPFLDHLAERGIFI